MDKEIKGLTNSSCIRNSKDEIRKAVNKALNEMPNGFYYQYEIKVLTKKEYLAIENDKNKL